MFKQIPEAVAKSLNICYSAYTACAGIFKGKYIMRSILFKLSEKESLEFEVARTNAAGTKLSPRKFFLRAVQKELESVMAEATSDEPDQE